MNIERLKEALVNADRAGDVQAAKLFAAKIRELQAVEPQEDEEVDFSVSKMVSNIPSSAKNLAGDMWHAVTNPVDTLGAIGGLVESGVEQLNPFMTEEDERYREHGEAFVDAVKGRYGSLDALKKTAMNDPVGMLADASGVAGLSGKVARVPKLAKAGMAIDPVNLVGNTLKSVPKAYTALRPGAANSMYQSAAKFSTTLGPAERAAITNTALKHNIMPTVKGMDKLSALKNAYATQIDSMITVAEKTGQKIPVDAVFRGLKDLRREMGGMKISGADSLSKIDNVAKKFHQHAKDMGRDYFTPKELQNFKVDLYNEINWNQTQQSAKRATTAAQKAIGKSAKESIEKFHPEIKPTNKKLGDLLELEPNLQKSAARIENRDIIGIGAPIKVGTGAMLDSPALTAAATLSAVADIPQWKALTAIKLHNLQNQGLLGLYGGNSDLGWSIRQGLLQGGRLEQNQ